MNFQEKLFEASAELRNRAADHRHHRPETARSPRADAAAKRVEKLKGSIAVLNTAGREFNKVARRHAIRFVKQNSTLAPQVREDVVGAGPLDLRDADQAAAAEEGASSPPPRASARERPPQELRPPVAGHSRLATPSAPRSRGALLFANSQIC